MYKIYYMGHLIPDNYLRNRRKRCMVKNRKCAELIPLPKKEDSKEISA